MSLSKEGIFITILNVNKARADRYKLINDPSVSHVYQCLSLVNVANAVLLAEDDWSAINETLHLLLVPGIRDSILEGTQEKIGDCAAELE